MSGLYTGSQTKYSHLYEGDHGPLCRLDTRDLSGSSYVEGLKSVMAQKRHSRLNGYWQLLKSEKNESR